MMREVSSRNRSRSSVPAWVVAAAIAPLPFLYGAVHPPARGLYVVIATSLLIAHAFLRARAGRRVAPNALVVAVAAGAVTWAALSLAPMPGWLLRVVAPATWRLVIRDFEAAGLDAPAWHPIAVTPWAAAEGWATAAAHLAIFVVSIAAFSGHRGARVLAGTAAGIGSAIASLAIAQQLAGARRIYFIGLEREQFYGTFVNGNHTAAFLAVCALAALGPLARERDIERKAAWGVAAVLCAVGSMNALSRGGIVSFAVGLGVFALGAIATQAARTRTRDEIGRFFRRHGLAVMLLALAVFYMSWLGPRKIGRELATLAALDLPQDYRVKVWQDAAGALADWPVTGAGPGNFGEVFPAYRTFDTGVRTEMAESEYVQAAVEGGLPALLLVLALVGLVLGPFALRFFADPFRFSGAHLGFAAGLCALATHAAVDFPLRVPAVGAFAAALAGALVGAVRRNPHANRTKAPATPRGIEETVDRLPGDRRTGGKRRERQTVLRAAAWVLLAPAAWAALAASFADRAAASEGRPLTEAVRQRPADARGWLRLARAVERDPAAFPGADARRLWDAGLRRDPSSTAVQRMAAAAYARLGDPVAASGALYRALALRPSGGAETALRLELAEQLFWAGDFEGSRAALAVIGTSGGARVAMLHADLQAAGGSAPNQVGSSPNQVSPAELDSARIAVRDAYLAAAHAAAKDGDLALRARATRRAVLVSANAIRGVEPAAARAAFDALASAPDPGEALVELEALAARGAIDAARIWGGAPRLRVDAFDGGAPRLAGGAAEIVEHAILGGAERLTLRYPGQGVLADVWRAPLAIRSGEPRLRLRLQVRADSRLGDQLCVEAEGRRVFGTLEPSSGPGARTLTVPVVGAVDAWCFDTRGRPGPWYFDELDLVLSGTGVR